MIQTIPPASTTDGYPSCVIPLAFVIFVEGITVGFEDRRRHKADSIANARVVRVLDAKSGVFIVKKCADIVVGDIVKIENRELVPADMLLLCTRYNLPTF